MRWLPSIALSACLTGSPDADDPVVVPLGVGLAPDLAYGGAPFVPGTGDLSFVEIETGSRFNLFGQAYDGPLAESRMQLEMLPGVTAFWFAWSTHHPGARVWNNRDNHPGVVIGRDGGCFVPCDEIVPGCDGGMDCIPSIDEPVWIDAGGHAALEYLTDDDRVLGISRNGLARAYPLDTLWTHEIVNDRWGEWAFSVTYCPLTGSGVLADQEQREISTQFGVSGNLWNSNLMMYDRTTRSLWVQLRLQAVQGPRGGTRLVTGGLVDTTWGVWRRAFPQTQVLDERYEHPYPYGNYRTNSFDTFMETNPPPDPLYPNKSYAIGLVTVQEAVIYPFRELWRTLGGPGIVHDEVGGVPVLVAYDPQGPTAVIYGREHSGEIWRFE